MWPKDFESRLSSWAELRANVANQDLPTCLNTINEWWNQTPWVPHYLHWDDIDQWPDPWQILADNVYCDVVKSLGICYTVIMLNRNDHGPIELVQTADGYNLVHFTKEKYVLNMGTNVVVNTNLTDIKRRMTQQQISNRCN